MLPASISMHTNSSSKVRSLSGTEDSFMAVGFGSFLTTVGFLACVSYPQEFYSAVHGPGLNINEVVTGSSSSCHMALMVPNSLLLDCSSVNLEKF